MQVLSIKNIVGVGALGFLSYALAIVFLFGELAPPVKPSANFLSRSLSTSARKRPLSLKNSSFNSRETPNRFLKSSPDVKKSTPLSNNTHLFVRKPFTEANFTQLKHFWVDSYLSWHARNRFNASAKTFVYIVQRSGFGDIFRGLLTSYYMAVLSKRVLLIKYPPLEHLDEVLEIPTGNNFFYSEFDATRERQHGHVLHLNDKRLNSAGMHMRLNSLLRVVCGEEHTFKFKHARETELTDVISKWHKLFGDKHEQPMQCSYQQGIQLQHVLLQDVFS
eukprot:IDg19774t1